MQDQDYIIVDDGKLNTVVQRVNELRAEGFEPEPMLYSESRNIYSVVMKREEGTIESVKEKDDLNKKICNMQEQIDRLFQNDKMMRDHLDSAINLVTKALEKVGNERVLERKEVEGLSKKVEDLSKKVDEIAEMNTSAKREEQEREEIDVDFGDDDSEGAIYATIMENGEEKRVAIGKSKLTFRSDKHDDDYDNKIKGQNATFIIEDDPVLKKENDRMFDCDGNEVENVKDISLEPCSQKPINSNCIIQNPEGGKYIDLDQFRDVDVQPGSILFIESDFHIDVKLEEEYFFKHAGFIPLRGFLCRKACNSENGEEIYRHWFEIEDWDEGREENDVFRKIQSYWTLKRNQDQVDLAQVELLPMPY